LPTRKLSTPALPMQALLALLALLAQRW
jgi:hypothetical protein